MTYGCATANMGVFATLAALDARERSGKIVASQQGMASYRRYLQDLQKALFNEYALCYLCWNHPRTFERVMVVRNFIAGADTAGKLTLTVEDDGKSKDKRSVPIYVPFQKSDCAPLHVFNEAFQRMIQECLAVMRRGEEECKTALLSGKALSAAQPMRFSKATCDAVEAIINKMAAVVHKDPESIGLGELGCSAFFPHYDDAFRRHAGHNTRHFLKDAVVWFVPCDVCGFNADGAQHACPVCATPVKLNKAFSERIPEYAARTKCLSDIPTDDAQFGDGKG